MQIEGAMVDGARVDRLPVPAGFLARYAAWSLDALMVSAAAMLLTWQTMASGVMALHAAWANFQQVIVSRMAEVLLQAVDPAGVAAQLMHDPAILAAATTAETALRALLLPPMLTFAALAALYWIGCERSVWQATPGKRAMALQVTDLNGHRLDVTRAATRHFAGALSWLTLNLGHALAAVPPHRRALHDYVAGTHVVHGDGDPRPPGWAKVWIALQVLIAFALPMWLALRYAAVLHAFA